MPELLPLRIRADSDDIEIHGMALLTHEVAARIVAQKP